MTIAKNLLNSLNDDRHKNEPVPASIHKETDRRETRRPTRDKTTDARQDDRRETHADARQDDRRETRRQTRDAQDADARIRNP